MFYFGFIEGMQVKKYLQPTECTNTFTLRNSINTHRNILKNIFEQQSFALLTHTLYIKASLLITPDIPQTIIAFWNTNHLIHINVDYSYEHICPNQGAMIYFTACVCLYTCYLTIYLMVYLPSRSTY